MKLRLLYKSYARPGLLLTKGQVHEFPDAEAQQLLEAFSGWFERVFEPKAHKEKGPAIQLVEETPPAGEAAQVEEAPPPVEAF